MSTAFHLKWSPLMCSVTSAASVDRLEYTPILHFLPFFYRELYKHYILHLNICLAINNHISSFIILPKWVNVPSTVFLKWHYNIGNLLIH